MNIKDYILKAFITTIFLYLGVLFITNGCSKDWTEAIRSGNTHQEQFRQDVDIEIKNGLIFLPVSIQGQTYRFLFDTGAPLSISQKIQNALEYEVVSKGNIIDSDHNNQEVKWVQVDSILIGDISFQKQVAFIGDFEANPLLSCLEIDGIIGSNLIRHCNWRIDQNNKSTSLFKGIESLDHNEGITIPFKTDHQYNMFVDINIGQASLKNVLVDFGSNGSIALNHEIFTLLQEREILDSGFHENGSIQSGIVGEKAVLKRSFVYSDSVRIGNITLQDVLLRTGKTVSIGTKFLSQFIVTINWDNRTLHLAKDDSHPSLLCFPGFRLGYSNDLGMYVQSIVLKSNAYNEGVRPNMRVIKLDGLDFENGNNFCDYVDHKLSLRILMELSDSIGSRKIYQFKQTAR